MRDASGRARWRLLVVGLLLLSAGCRYQPSTIVLQGTSTDIAALAGDWGGEYAGIESRRTGSIMFTIVAGKDTAFGDVIMTPTLGEPVHAADARTDVHRQHARAAELLRASFVRVDGRLIRGELEPYVAPDCQCVVTTVFRGIADGDRIQGEFVTRGDHGLLQEGRWFVVRRR